MSDRTKILTLGAASELAAEIVRLRALLIENDICPEPGCGGRIAWKQVPERPSSEEKTDDHRECVACQRRYEK